MASFVPTIATLDHFGEYLTWLMNERLPSDCFVMFWLDGLFVTYQVAAFIVASGAGIGFVRPIAMRHIKQPPTLRSGTAALVGRSAIVLEEVTEHRGRIRIGGEEWSSRAYDESLVIPVGTKVDVMQIDGATALVYPRE